MANIKNFGLVGVGTDVQFGKDGNRLVSGEEGMLVRNASGNEFADISLGNVILNRGELSQTIFLEEESIIRLGGMGAVIIPTGEAADRPETGNVGMLRTIITPDVIGNVANIEYFNGTDWSVVASVANLDGVETRLSADISAIETALGTMFADGSFDGNVFTTANADLWPTPPATLTDAITGMADRLSDSLSLDSLLPGTTGQIIYHNGTNWVAGAPGAASGVQAHSTKLDSLVAQADAGILVQKGDGSIGVAAESDIASLVDSRYVNVAGDTMTGDLNFGGTARVTGLASPVAASDAANKAYVDSAITGLTWKNAVAVLAASNIALTGLQVIDGYTVVAGDRVLVIGQTTDTENGIYVAAEGAWSRSTDADEFGELNGAAVFVRNGDQYKDSGFTQTAELTTFAGQTWVQFSGAGAFVAGSGLKLEGNVFSVNMGAGIKVLPDDEVGLDLVAGGALQLTNETDSGQLGLVLDANSGLSQTATGLKVADGGIDNAKLANSSITVGANTGVAEVVALGESFNIVGDADGDITTAVVGGNIEVSLGTVSVTKGGTGRTSFTDGAVLLGGATGITESTGITYVDGSLSVGKVTVNGIDGNIVGSTGLVIGAVTGDVLMSVSTGSVIKVADSTAANYTAAVVADNDIPNKLYVDNKVNDAIAGVSSTGSHRVVVPFDASSTTVTSTIPVGSEVYRIVVTIVGTSAVDAGMSIQDGFIPMVESSEVDTASAGRYLVDLSRTTTDDTLKFQFTGTATGLTGNVAIEYYGDAPVQA